MTWHTERVTKTEDSVDSGPDGARITVVSCPTSRTLLETVFSSFRGRYRKSLLRLILLESRSALYRIWSERRRSGVLDFAEIRRSLPRVSCSDSRNEMQFCSASIRALSEDRAYLTLEDLRLFLEGWFLAEQWYAHSGTGDRNAQQAGVFDTMSHHKSRGAVKNSLGWDRAIADAQQLLDKVEARAGRIRGAIRTLKEARAAGEPYVKGQSDSQNSQPCHVV